MENEKEDFKYKLQAEWLTLTKEEAKAILDHLDHDFVPGDNIILRNLIQRMIQFVKIAP